MKQENDILNELKQMGSPLADMSRDMPYYVPKGYFEQLPEQALGNALSTQEYDFNLNIGKPFSVPDNYFEQFPAQVLQAIKANEDAETVKKIKTIPLNRAYKWYSVKWAAAAVLLICVSIFSYRFIMPNHTPEHELASIPQNEIAEYAMLHTDDPAELEMLDKNGVMYATPQHVTLQLTEEEITQYLNEKGVNETELN
jgi:hypothetical protein